MRFRLESKLSWTSRGRPLAETDCLCRTKKKEGEIVMKVIRTKELTKSYGKSRGITGLALTVEQGDFFGFIGPNGAGKSTTIRTLLGLIKPNSGEASVLGHDILTEQKSILSKVGYLPSEISYYKGMRVKDVLRYSAELHRVKCGDEAKNLCERLHLDADKKAENLSLGNRKNGAIICELQHDPELLIMDEPTSGLDPLIQREFFTILKERNDRGKTIFFSSHILSEVQSYCRSAAFIKDGRIIVSDKVERLEETGAKKVTIRGMQSQLDTEALGGEEAVRNAMTEENTVSFLYRGEVKRLLSYLSKCELFDVSIEEPSLEEIFMQYYDSSTLDM